MATFHLQPSDARLMYLAVLYHLGRPGSETDPATLRPHQLGLAPLRDALDAQLEPPRDGAAPPAEVVALELSPYQLTRLGVALHGTVNELKQFGMAGGRSAVPGFAEAFARLFPPVTSGPAVLDLDPATSGPAALDLVPAVVMLRRRLDGAVREAEQQVAAAREAQAQAAAAAGGPPLWRRLVRHAARTWRR